MNLKNDMVNEVKRGTIMHNGPEKQIQMIDNEIGCAQKQSLVIEDGTECQEKQISISGVAWDFFKKRFENKELSIIGRSLSKAYEFRHGHKPKKHDQNVDGSVTKVNTYYMKDVDLVKQAILHGTNVTTPM
mmetsp:Transcript_24100/g.38958  ORF Transcript_24100/g.38958 Transcript_24100/m.38958 type:complete len:131 (+) Transcript_24100:1-393(+)